MQLSFSCSKEWDVSSVPTDIPLDPEIVKGILRATITGGGLVGLFCGLFILFL